MDRREVLQLGAASIAVAAISDGAFAQVGWKNHLDAYSRTLHWCRTPGEVAQACHEIGNTTIDLTIRPYPGHVQPEKVKTDLPVFVNGLKREGITVTKVAMDFNEANTPNLEDMLATASSLGIHHCWWRGLTFDYSQPYTKQLDALKPRAAAVAQLMEKHGVKACWHPFSGFTEIMDVLRNFDPRYLALSYDTGNLGQFNQGTLANQIRIAGPYVGSFVFKENTIEKLTPEQIAARAAAPAAGRGPAPGANPPAGAAGAAPAGNAAAGRGAGGGGRGAGGPGGNAGSPNGFTQRQVPVGTGILNLPVICQALKDINFQGPIECQPEWPELGGPGQGLDKLSIPRDQVIAMLKRDFVTVSTPLQAAGVI